MRIEIIHDSWAEMHPTKLGPPAYSLRIDGILQAPDTWSIVLHEDPIQRVTKMTLDLPGVTS